MLEFLRQFGLLARDKKGDGGGLMQLVVLGVMAALYLFGAIAKSRAGRESKEGEESPSEKSTRGRETIEEFITKVVSEEGNFAQKKSTEITRADEWRSKRLEQRAVSTGDQAGRLGADVRKPRTQPLAAARQGKPQQAQKPMVQPVQQAAKKIEPAKRTEIPAAEEAEVEFAEQLHLDEPQDLQKAIVYAEILGKPVGLRTGGEDGEGGIGTLF
ncbi:MAG: hypothetical protein ABIG61_10650 [Planctomycetota bacterium]